MADGSFMVSAKTRDELVAEMEKKIKAQNSEYMNEIATPGVVIKPSLPNDNK